MAKDPDRREVYLQELREGCEELEIRVLVLPDSMSSSAAVEKLEEALELFGKGGEVRGVKRSGEGVGEGWEERRKRVRNQE